MSKGGEYMFYSPLRYPGGKGKPFCQNLFCSWKHIIKHSIFSNKGRIAGTTGQIVIKEHLNNEGTVATNIYLGYEFLTDMFMLDIRYDNQKLVSNYDSEEKNIPPVHGSKGILYILPDHRRTNYILCRQWCISCSLYLWNSILPDYAHIPSVSDLNTIRHSYISSYR